MITNLTDAGTSNLVCAVTLANADHELRIIFRYVDGNNYLLLKAAGRTRAELWARQGGVWQRLTASLDAYTSGDRFEVRAIGTSLRAYRNGTLVASAADGRFRTSGICGLDVDAESVVSGFTVTGADGPPPPVPVKLGPVAAYYPDDPKYFDAEIP